MHSSCADVIANLMAFCSMLIGATLILALLLVGLFSHKTGDAMVSVVTKPIARPMFCVVVLSSFAIMTQADCCRDLKAPAVFCSVHFRSFLRNATTLCFLNGMIQILACIRGLYYAASTFPGELRYLLVQVVLTVWPLYNCYKSVKSLLA